MITLYLDWSVISQIKQGNYPELAQLLSDKGTFSIIYSTSHISDLLVSYNGIKEQTDRIYEDLAFISGLTDDFCAFTENVSVIVDQRNPFELFDQRVLEADAFNSDDLFDIMLKDFEPGSVEYKAILSWKDSPMPKEISTAFGKPQSAVAIRKLFPGLTKNSTTGNLVNLGWKRYKRMMETDEYKNVRGALQKQLKLKPNQLIGTQPFQKIESLYKDTYNKLQELVTPKVNDKANYPNWFQNIANNYLTLDIHGYHEDRVNIDKGRKETMRNTVDDGFHCAFAALCEFYITSDKKATMKSKAVYEHLNIGTIVQSPVEFIDIQSGYHNQ